jgi:hypothetical protein
MESFRTWLQDWSDACEYAKECAPDLSFLAPHEPYTALAAIAAACLFVWWWNEKRINPLVDAENRYRRPAEAAPAAGLRLVLDDLSEMCQQRRAAA